VQIAKALQEATKLKRIARATQAGATGRVPVMVVLSQHESTPNLPHGRTPISLQ